MGKSLGNIFRSVIVPAVLTAVTGGAAAPLFGVTSGLGTAALIGGANAAYSTGRALNNSASLGNALKQGAISGVASGAGSYLGSGGTVGGYGITSPGNTVGGTLANNAPGLYTAANAAATSSSPGILGSALNYGLNASTGGVGGALAGNSLASSLNPAKVSVPNQTPAGFVPKQQDALDLPSSLQGFGGLNQNQQTSNLANQGTYGGGLGPQENQYFLNLVNRQLVDKSGQVSDASSLSPIENSYLQKLGLGGYGNSNNLLEAISKWKAA